MRSLLSDDICKKILDAEGLYDQLVLVVGREGTGKTSALQAVAESVNAALINVNLELSRRLLELAERQRPLRVHPLLQLVLAEHETDIVLLDNIEILFDAALRQDPLRLLQGLSRNRKIAAAWTGSIENRHVHYAAPGHPEYRCYSTDSLLTVNAEATE